jgi:RND family efflux transporter MFP subunit
VKLQKLQTSTLIDSSQFVGALEAKERVILRPETAGRVSRILVASGDRVEVGTPIVQLSPERSQAEVNRAQADIESARSAVRTAQAELAAAQADVKSAQSEVNLQNEEYQRTQFLVSEGAQAQQQLDRVERDRESARSQLEAAQKQVNAARSRLEQERSALNRAQAELQVVQEDLNDNRISSPINGTIGDINIEIGEYVQAGDNLTVISQNDVLELNLRIPIEQADRLQKGLTVELSTANSEQPLLTGQINFIAPQVDMGAQAVLAKAVFSNSNGKLKDDQFVRANIIWEEQTGVLIPTTAVSRLGGQTFAFVAQPSESGDQLIAKQKAVELGSIQGNSYQVISGLKPGDTLVASGILNLSDGATIMPQSETQAESQE